MDQTINSPISGQPGEPGRAGKKHPKRLIILTIVAIIIIGAGIYFFTLVRENIKNINGQGNTNQTETGIIATSDDPYQGNPDARVVIVEFSDFQCPYCSQFFPVLRELIGEYGDKVKLIYRDFPDTAAHANAQKAAEAGECAQEQGNFWAMHDKMFINQNDLSVPALKQYAFELNMEADSFNECLDSGKYETEVLQDFYDGLFAGVSVTPTIFINNTKFEGVVTVEVMKNMVDQFIVSYGL